MGDVPQAGGDGSADPNPIASGGCSDPVSVELSMGGDYYHACCGDANLDIPEGPKLPFVGNKASVPAPRSSPLASDRLLLITVRVVKWVSISVILPFWVMLVVAIFVCQIKWYAIL
jgi:hypothetical protein